MRVKATARMIPRDAADSAPSSALFGQNQQQGSLVVIRGENCESFKKELKEFQFAGKLQKLLNFNRVYGTHDQRDRG